MDGLVNKYGHWTNLQETDLANKLTGILSKNQYYTWAWPFQWMYLSNHLKKGDTYTPQGRLVIEGAGFDSDLDSALKSQGVKSDRDDI